MEWWEREGLPAWPARPVESTLWSNQKTDVAASLPSHLKTLTTSRDLFSPSHPMPLSCSVFMHYYCSHFSTGCPFWSDRKPKIHVFTGLFQTFRSHFSAYYHCFSLIHWLNSIRSRIQWNLDVTKCRELCFYGIEDHCEEMKIRAQVIIITITNDKVKMQS